MGGSVFHFHFHTKPKNKHTHTYWQHYARDTYTYICTYITVLYYGNTLAVYVHNEVLGLTNPKAMRETHGFPFHSCAERERERERENKNESGVCIHVHSLAHSCTSSLIHSLTHSLIYSDSLTHSLTLQRGRVPRGVAEGLATFSRPWGRYDSPVTSSRKNRGANSCSRVVFQLRTCAEESVLVTNSNIHKDGGYNLHGGYRMTRVMSYAE